MSKTQTQEELDRLTEKETELGRTYLLILWNDEVNTFDHVIFCLTTHLNYSYEQAEKITNIVHNDGHHPILQGSFTEIEVFRKILKAEGLTVSIE